MRLGRYCRATSCLLASPPIGAPRPKLILPGGLADHKTYVTETLPVRVYETFMDSQIGGKLIRTKMGGDPMKNVKMLTDEDGSVESSVFLGGPSNDFKVGMRRVSVKATSEGGDTVLELEETKKGGLVIAVILVGLSFCLVPGLFFMMKNMMATKKHKGLLEELKNEVLSNVEGARAVDAE